jgi:AcrR family transcriptional regulator
MVKTAKRNPARPSVGDRRRAAMVQAAYTLFMERGFESVSVDDIIRVSGGSKATLYKFFGNKEGILRAVVESLADEMLREFSVEFPAARTVRESLLHIGTALADLALSENAINQHRHAVAHARAFPDVARLWYESGPKRSIEGIAAFLERETAAGRMRVDDPLRTAWLFGGMILFKNNMRLLVGAPPEKKAEMRKTVTEAVDAFLAAYGS